MGAEAAARCGSKNNCGAEPHRTGSPWPPPPPPPPTSPLLQRLRPPQPRACRQVPCRLPPSSHLRQRLQYGLRHPLYRRASFVRCICSSGSGWYGSSYRLLPEKHQQPQPWLWVVYACAMALRVMPAFHAENGAASSTVRCMHFPSTLHRRRPLLPIAVLCTMVQCFTRPPHSTFSRAPVSP